MDNNQNSNNNNNVPSYGNSPTSYGANPTGVNTNPSPATDTNGMQDAVKTDYYNNNSYYSNNNYESNYSDTSYEEKEKKNGIWWKILLAILIILIIIILLLRFCVGGSKSDDEKYTALKTRICAAAETYIMNNPSVLDRTEPGKSATIKYQKLSDENLIEAQIVNPYYKGGLFNKSNETKYYSLDNSVRLTVAADLTLACELVDNSQDVTAPVIRLNGDAEVTFAIGTEFQDPLATATDDYDGDLTEKIVRSGNVDLTKAGTYELTYTVSDSAGNTSSIKRTIIYEEYPNLEVTLGSILDGVTPMISLKGANPYCLVKGTKYVEPGATATDNVDGNITNKIAVTNKITGNLIGSFRVTYKVEDTSGNQAVAYRAVIVSTECPDQTGNGNAANNAPKITLIGKNSVTINVGTEYIDLGATAYDKEDGDITSKMTPDATQVNTNRAGVYKVLYRVTDSAGVTTNASRTVTVKSAVSGNPSVRFTEDKENIAVIVGEGSDSLLNSPKAVNENGAAVNVTKYIEDYNTKVAVSAIDWNKEGQYRVIYTATHANGVVSQSKSIVVTIFSDTIKIGGKDAINVNKRTENCDLNEADLLKGGVTFEYKGSTSPIINLKGHEKKACEIGTYEITVTATPSNGVPATKKVTVYVVNGTGESVNPKAPSQVIITKNTANSSDPYNGTANWVGNASTGITVDFKSTPAPGTTIAKYQWSTSCSTVEGELGTTSETTGSLNWLREGKKSVCIRAVSSEGYAGLWSNPVNLYIDKTGPGVVFTHSWADGKDDWHNSDSLTLSYKGIDEASGVDHFEYTYDDVKAKKALNKESEIVTTTITSNNLIVSENTEPLRPELFVFVRAVDKAGNKGPWIEKPAYANMDTIKPNTPTASILENSTVQPKITATATDANNTITNRYSGIGSFKFVLVDQLNNLTTKTSTATMIKENDISQGGTTTFKMPTHVGDDKTYNVKVYAVDKAGNESVGFAELSATVKGGEAATNIKAVCPTGATAGGNGSVTVDLTPTNAAERDFTYASSDTSIATIDENGKVKYIKAGNVTVTVRLIATKSTFESTCTLTIANPSSGSGTGGGGYSPDGPLKAPAGTKIVYVQGVYGNDENGASYVQAFEIPEDSTLDEALKSGATPKETYTFSSKNSANAAEFKRIIGEEEFEYGRLLNYTPSKEQIDSSLGYDLEELNSTLTVDYYQLRDDTIAAKSKLSEKNREIASLKEQIKFMADLTTDEYNNAVAELAKKEKEAKELEKVYNDNFNKQQTVLDQASQVVESKATQAAVAAVNNQAAADASNNYQSFTTAVSSNPDYIEAWNQAQSVKIDSYLATMKSSTASAEEKAAASAKWSSYMT